jgi:hypothetical protein
MEEEIVGIIYLLTDKNKKCYVGQSIDIYNRIQHHTQNIKNNRANCSSKELDIDFICETLEDNITEGNLTLREQYWYDFYREKCGELLVNKCRPLNTKKEYYQQHAEEIREQSKDYRQQHAEEIREQRKAYRQQHIEEIREINKKYSQKKYNCECGTIISLDNKQRHFKTQKHINYLTTTTPTGFA